MFDVGLVVFSGKDCPSCKLVKATLELKGIEYTEYDIWNNADALKFIMSKGYRSIPQLFKDGFKVEVDDV